MKRELKEVIIILAILLLYFILNVTISFSVPCLFHEITGLYCPGCGITRMIIAIYKLDFYQAFRYNPLVFIMLPFIVFLVVDYIHKKIVNKKPVYQHINDKIWYAVIIIFILYGILRNIFPILAPTIID